MSPELWGRGINSRDPKRIRNPASVSVLCTFLRPGRGQPVIYLIAPTARCIDGAARAR